MDFHTLRRTESQEAFAVARRNFTIYIRAIIPGYVARKYIKCLCIRNVLCECVRIKFFPKGAVFWYQTLYGDGMGSIACQVYNNYIYSSTWNPNRPGLEIDTMVPGARKSTVLNTTTKNILVWLGFHSEHKGFLFWILLRL